MDNKKIDLYYEYVDKAIMVLYNELHIDYIEGIIRVSHDLAYEINENGLSEEAVNELTRLYTLLNNDQFSNEDIRYALQLLIIKGFKHIDYSLDLMTPDGVNFLIGYLISKLCPYPIDLIDTAVGTGNLINAVIDFPGVEIMNSVGIDNDLSLVNLCAAVSDLLNNGVKVYYQNAVSPIIDVADVIIGDLPAALTEEKDGINYLPYQIIKERMSNLRDGGFFIYLINNDFFSYKNSSQFKNEIDQEATLLGLLVLDNKMFKDSNSGKSLLVGVKEKLTSYDMMVQMVKLNDQVEIEKVKKSIDQWSQIIRRNQNEKNYGC